MSAEFDFMTAHELRARIATRAISPVDVVRRALERADASQSSLNAYCVLMPEQALAQARTAETAVMRGQALGALHGLPLSVKDLIAVRGLPYLSGSKTMLGNVAAQDAPSVQRVREAGAILVGKTTTSEFGCKPVGDSPLTGITRHPWNLDCSPGGSSAGAAASVAAGITPLALGTDGGGSLRIPASLTGLVGFKASFGRVPVWPVSATPTLAHVGPLARNVRDAALLGQVIAGYDARDPFAVAGPVPDMLAACERPVHGMRVAFSPTLGYARPQPEVLALVEHAVRKLEDQGAVVEKVDPVFESDPAGLWMAEFYAGVGTRLRSHVENQFDVLDPAVGAVLKQALGQSMRDYYDSVFRRYALRDHLRQFFERYDVLVTPTLPVARVPAGVNVPPGYEDRNLLDWVFYTYPFNLGGQPALSLCAGIGGDGMPAGIQVVGKVLGEADILSTAAAIERAMPAGYNLRTT